MVISNPKLSLPTDLPYKKRQRPFNPNTSLQQATVRYNEAIRKEYNDVQFAKRYENGYISQNELMSVNTVDIVKTVDPNLFLEMSNLLNPLPVSRQRKSRKVFICTGNSSSEVPSFRSSNRYYASPPSPVVEKDGGKASVNLAASVERQNIPPVQMQIDCNNTEMFPHLLSTVGSCQPSQQKQPVTSPPISSDRVGPYISRSLNKYPSTSSLEAQAINEYIPTADSAHDMIFGHVMGIEYGNYIHDHLWPTPQQSCSGNDGNNLLVGPFHFNSAQQIFQPPQPNVCGTSKSVGFNLPLSSHPYSHCGENYANYDSNIITISPLTNMGNHSGQYPGCSRRSTSVPRPRTGTRKETLKQAAIRCGIIKGNQTVPAISKRSHCFYPLPLTPVQSDSTLPVVEILHPRTLIPTCSSEALVDESYITSQKTTPQAEIGVGWLAEGEDTKAQKETHEGIEKETPLTEIRSIADIRTKEDSESTTSFY